MKATWRAPTTYVDGSPFGQPDLAGFELQLDDQPAVSVPFAWNDAGNYEFNFDSLELEPGSQHSARVLTVATNGRKSQWSNPGVFTYQRTPRPPFDLAIVG